MVKLFQQQFNFDYPWPTTTRGLWLKYPNPHAPHVFAVDTLSRGVDEDTGVLRTERLIGVRQGAPKWVMRLLGVTEDAFVREVIFVDPVQQVTSMVSINLSLSQYVQCLELISYTATDDTSQTLFTQRAHISSPPTTPPSLPYYSAPPASTSKSVTRLLRSVGGKLEMSSVERFGLNAAGGRKGFEGVLDNLKAMIEDRREGAVGWEDGLSGWGER